jgi:hypothetical protein
MHEPIVRCCIREMNCVFTLGAMRPFVCKKYPPTPIVTFFYNQIGFFYSNKVDLDKIIMNEKVNLTDVEIKPCRNRIRSCP